MGIVGSRCGKHYKIQAKISSEVVENGQTVLFNVCNRTEQQQQEETPNGDDQSVTRHASSQEFSANSNSQKQLLRGSSSSLSSTSSSELLTSNGTAESSGNLKSILGSNKSSPTARPLRSVTLILDTKEKEEIFASSTISKRKKGRRKTDKDNDPIEEDCIDIRVLSRRASLPSMVSFEGSLSTTPDRKVTGNFFYSVLEAPYSPADSTKTAPTLSTVCLESPSIRIIPPYEDLLECDVYPLPKKHALKDEKARKLQEKRLNPVKTWSKDELRKLAKKTKRATNPIAEDLMIYK